MCAAWSFDTFYRIAPYMPGQCPCRDWAPVNGHRTKQNMMKNWFENMFSCICPALKTLWYDWRFPSEIWAQYEDFLTFAPFCHLGMCFPHNYPLKRSNDLNLLLFYFIYFFTLFHIHDFALCAILLMLKFWILISYWLKIRPINLLSHLMALNKLLSGTCQKVLYNFDLSNDAFHFPHI